MTPIQKIKTVVLLAGGVAGLALFFTISGSMHEANAREEAAEVRAKAAQEKWKAEHPKEVAAAAKAQAEAQKAAQADAMKKKTQRLLAAYGAVQLKNAMKDPESFKLLSATMMADGSTCYDYSATNTFGGRMKEYAVLTPKGKILVNEPGVFNKYCANKTGEGLVASAE